MEKLQVGIQVLHIGGRDAIPATRKEVVKLGTHVEQDAFVDQGNDGFVASVKNELCIFGNGKLPKSFLLVVAERLEDTFLAFSGGAVDRELTQVLKHTNYAQYSQDETGEGYKEKNADYMPILVCVLGYSKSFQRWVWQSEEQPAYQPKHPVRVFSREQFEKCCESIYKFHAGIVTD